MSARVILYLCACLAVLSAGAVQAQTWAGFQELCLRSISKGVPVDKSNLTPLKEQAGPDGVTHTAFLDERAAVLVIVSRRADMDVACAMSIPPDAPADLRAAFFADADVWRTVAVDTGYVQVAADDPQTRTAEAFVVEGKGARVSVWPRGETFTASAEIWTTEEN